MAYTWLARLPYIHFNLKLFKTVKGRLITAIKEIYVLFINMQFSVNSAGGEGGGWLIGVCTLIWMNMVIS